MAEQINVDHSELLSLSSKVNTAIDEVAVQYSLFKSKMEILSDNWLGSEECGYQDALEIIEKEFSSLVQVLVKMSESIKFAQTQLLAKDEELTSQINTNISK